MSIIFTRPYGVALDPRQLRNASPLIVSRDALKSEDLVNMRPGGFIRVRSGRTFKVTGLPWVCAYCKQERKGEECEGCGSTERLKPEPVVVKAFAPLPLPLPLRRSTWWDRVKPDGVEGVALVGGVIGNLMIWGNILAVLVTF